MAQQHASRRMNLKWAVLALAAAGIAGVLAWVSGSDSTPPSPVPPAVSAAPPMAGPAAAPGVAGSGSAAALAGQQHAAAAALREVGSGHADGIVTQRPDFVSELEWQALQQVAGRSPQPAVELARLVNNLLFAKQLEAWRALAKSPDVAQRRALANQLLEDLPERVLSRDYDLPQARQLQQSLLADAVSDPSLRAVRADAEARRLTSAIPPEAVAPS